MVRIDYQKRNRATSVTDSPVSYTHLDVYKRQHENYAVAIDLLRNRYDSKLIVSAHHVGNVLDVPLVQQESQVSISKFIDEISANINALNNLKLPVNTFEIIVVNYLAKKLDNYTFRLWKESLSEHKFPDFNNFMNFLNSRRKLLQNLDNATTPTSRLNKSDKSPYRKAVKQISAPRGAFHSDIRNNLCRLCNGCLLYTSVLFLTCIPEFGVFY